MSALPDWKRTSTGIRYDEPIRFRFLGDSSVARVYIPVARVIHSEMRNQASLGGINHNIFSRVFQDGTVVRCIWDGATDIIEIDVRQRAVEGLPKDCKFYLESGVIDQELAGELFPEESRPGELYRSSFDTPPEEKIKVNGSKIIFGDMPEDGGESLSMGGKIFSSSAATDEQIEEYATRLFQKHKAATYIPASLYSGKMQLLVQSKYGADFAYWNGEVMIEPSKPKYLKLENTKLPWYFEDQYGLITNTNTYDYYLVRIRVVGNSFRYSYHNVVLSECARFLRAYLLKRIADEDISKPEIKRLEAYILSSAIFGEEIEIKSPGDILGQPFGEFHGWSYNWDGSEARIITQQWVKPNPAIDKYDVIGNHYKLEFSFPSQAIPGADPFSISLGLEESATFAWATNEVVAWYYDYVREKMWHAKSVGVNTLSYGDGPMYGFFNNEDKYVIVRFKYDERDLTDDFVVDTGEWYICGSSPTSLYAEDYKHNGVGAEFGLYSVIDGEEVDTKVTKNTPSEYYLQYLFSGAFTGGTITEHQGQCDTAAVYGTGGCVTGDSGDLQCGTLFDSLGIPNRAGTFTISEMRWDGYLDNQNRSNVTRRYTFIIPRHDPAAAYYGWHGTWAVHREQDWNWIVGYGKYDFVSDNPEYHQYDGSRYDGTGLEHTMLVGPNPTALNEDTDGEDYRMSFIERAAIRNLSYTEDDWTSLAVVFIPPDPINPSFSPSMPIVHGLQEDIVYPKYPGDSTREWDYDSFPESPHSAVIVGWSGADQEEQDDYVEE